MTSSSAHPSALFAAIRSRLLSTAMGLGLGAFIAFLFPGQINGHGVDIPLWLLAPFALLLGSIALMPFISVRIWHRHYADFALFLGGVVTAYYLIAFSGAPGHGHTLSYGSEKVLHAALEYYSFIALVGGLFVVSGGILIDLRGRGGPKINTSLLMAGAIIANIVGTTGASMLLIRPFMRVNKGRLRPMHIVFFIFVVSNCGGLLTPIGDPPLYLGFLKGVPFLWPSYTLWPSWILTVGLLLGVFYIFDLRVGPARMDAGPPVAQEPEAAMLTAAEIHEPRGLSIRGTVGLVCLALMIAGVFIDPLLAAVAGIHGIPVGPTFQILVAIAAYRLSPVIILAENDFSFGPVKEVGILFLGIFATMVPALAYLSTHGQQLGLTSTTAFYFGTGLLSAVLDNAPTYLNFFQIAYGPEEITAAGIPAFLANETGNNLLAAVASGAVFFGAMTYIGNGPNFMVKAIAESAAVRMPSFFGYTLRACLILLPILILHWLLLVR
jgi:Na+/H+ antiporter NhaD/arsenite permease-like protein